jgi:hypothetical protein
MKILYISKGDHVDYQDDCLSIGLKELFGSDVVDINKRDHIYNTYDSDKATKLYGMGMSVTRVLPELEVDRTDIQSKIKNKYFDYIVYGSIWRCHSDINKVLEYYPKNRVIVVDGEDETNINQVFDLGITYFKRELIHKHKRLFPISFTIPTCKINFVKDKIRDVAICDPRDRSTYIYKNEVDYYNGYQEARLAVTIKKAGWDCMRHYEILANGCLPYFIDIERCPELTMTNFPKQLCLDLNKDVNKMGGVLLYEKYADMFEKHLLNYNTTKAQATIFINTINNNFL